MSEIFVGQIKKKTLPQVSTGPTPQKDNQNYWIFHSLKFFFFTTSFTVGQVSTHQCFDPIPITLLAPGFVGDKTTGNFVCEVTQNKTNYVVFHVTKLKIKFKRSLCFSNSFF